MLTVNLWGNMRKLVCFILYCCLACTCEAEELSESIEQRLASVHRDAKQGDVLAQVLLGRVYYTGGELPQDYKEAEKWYRKAAEQGNVYSQCQLAGMYFKGVGVQQDYEQALKWLRLAADQGESGAHFALGKMYWDGFGVDQDFDESAKWFNSAARLGNKEAQQFLNEVAGSPIPAAGEAASD